MVNLNTTEEQINHNLSSLSQGITTPLVFLKSRMYEKEKENKTADNFLFARRQVSRILLESFERLLVKSRSLLAGKLQIINSNKVVFQLKLYVHGITLFVHF